MQHVGEWIRSLGGRLSRWLELPVPWLVGLSLLWLGVAGVLLADPPALTLLPGQLGLARAAWRMRDTCLGERAVRACLFALVGSRALVALQAGSPEAWGWELACMLAVLPVAALAVVCLVDELVEHRPWREHRRERWAAWAAGLLGILGLALGAPLLVMPLLARPVLRWLRREELRGVLVSFAICLAVVLVWAWSRQFGRFLLEQDDQNVTVNLGSGLLSGGRLLSLLGPLHTLALAWLGLQLPGALLLLVGRLLRQSRIRTKLVMNALLSSVLPLLLLTVLFGTLALVVLGSYRARLVRAQFDERLESGRLVTAWFAQAFADPLDREAQRRFEQQLRTMGEDSPVGRGFFCLYWSLDAPGGSVAPGDSLAQEHWRRLVATWRMPSDFPLEELVLPATWRKGRTSGVIRAGDHLWQVALIEQNNLLSAGFFPLDTEALEGIGMTLGTGLRLVALSGHENFVRFGFRQIGLGHVDPAAVLDQTADFPGDGSPWLDRLFQVGMARLTHRGFPLNAPDEELLVQVEALPGRILPTVFSDQYTVVFPYLFLLAIQIMILAPLLFAGIWIAWMLNLRITRSISELRHGTDALARGELEIRLPEHTGDELGRLASSFNEMSLRMREYIRELAAKERMERELSIARTIQQGLLPAAPPRHPRLDIACTCRMAQEVGGDYYDFRRTPTGELALALGDVSGKGVAAALLMSNLQASWRALLDQGLDPHLLNARLNQQLAETTADDMYVTFVQGLFTQDGERVRFRYSNAGHNPPLLVRDGQVRRLETGGLALGMFGEVGYQGEEVDLAAGDCLVFYTDGLTEAQSHDEEEFGQQRLEEALLRPCDRPRAKERLDGLLEEVARFEAGAPRVDDQTVLVLHVRDAAEGGLR